VRSIVIVLGFAATLAACGGVNTASLHADGGGAGAGGTSGGSAGGAPGQPGSGPCRGSAAVCAGHGDCCSGRCEPVTGVAETRCMSACFSDGVACQKALDCCSLGCFNGKCGGGLCKVESESCASNAECCSNICMGGQCQIDLANRNCRPTGETCTSGSGRGCCTDVCDESADPKRCLFGDQTCRAQGAACTANDQCCRGVCDPTTHACRTPCAAVGAACAGGGDCCTATCTAAKCAMPP
jgi:hypothetical protein